MSSETQNTTEQQASAQADASFGVLVSSWQAVFESIKLKVHSHTDLVAADFRLSVRAVVIAAICILIIVGIALLLWATLMIAMTYALFTYGLHWLICASLVVVCNIVAMVLVKRVLSSAISAISMKATAEALLTSDTDS